MAVEQQPGAAQIRRKSKGAEQRAVCCASARRQGQQSAGREQSRGFSYAREQAVKDSEALRKAVEEVQPLKVQLALRLSQSRPLCGPGPPRPPPGWPGCGPPLWSLQGRGRCSLASCLRPRRVRGVPAQPCKLLLR